MMKPAALAIAAATLAPMQALAQTTPAVAPGHYCLRAEIGGIDEDEAAEQAAMAAGGLSEADREKLALMDSRGVAPVSAAGQLAVDLDVTVKDGKTQVAFSTYMPDNRQIVRIEPVTAKAGAGGLLTFTFTDNWKGQGAGEVKPEGGGVFLSIKRTAVAPDYAGRYAERQYGEFSLKKATCPAYK